jgi:hypothetical protein
LDATTNADKWCALESGTLDYLKLDLEAMTFEWVSNVSESNPDVYKASEGIIYADGVATIAATIQKLILRLNVEDGTYTATPAPFTQEPDNLGMLGDVLYLCTDGDHTPDDGVWGIDGKGAFRVFKEVREAGFGRGRRSAARQRWSSDGRFSHIV